MMIAPISMLVAPSALGEEATANPLTTADMVKLLPTVVAIIFYNLAKTRSRGIAGPLGARPARASDRAKRGATEAAGSSDTTIYRLKITLDGVRPAIWRGGEVPRNAKLPFISRVMLAAMGWNDSHLHAFRVGAVTYGNPIPTCRAGCAASDPLLLQRSREGPLLLRLRLRRRLGAPCRGRVDRASRQQRRCAVSDSERACPPDDCGGGYRHLLNVLSNARHPEYRELRGWAGDDFDSEFFDVEHVNEELRRLVQPLRKGSRRRSPQNASAAIGTLRARRT